MFQINISAPSGQINIIHLDDAHARRVEHIFPIQLQLIRILTKYVLC